MYNGGIASYRAAIFTAIPVEYKAVSTHLSDLQEEKMMVETACERGIFVANNRVWDVMIVETGAGTTKTAAETVRAIERFEPMVVIFVGVAGGLKDVRLGDVVVASKVYGYEYGKSDPLFQTRPRVYYPTRRIARRALAASRRNEWLKRLQEDFSDPDDIPRVVIAPIASGNQVIASTDASVLQLLRSHYNDVAAVEMEGYGFLESAHAYPHIEALVVRGISDLIDNKLEADRQQFQLIAACRASAFTFEVLASLEIEERSLEKKRTASTQEKPPTEEQRQPEATPDSTHQELLSLKEFNSNLPDYIDKVTKICSLLDLRTGITTSQYNRALKWLSDIDRRIQMIRRGPPELMVSTRTLLAALQEQVRDLKATLKKFRRPSHFIKSSQPGRTKDGEYERAINVCDALLKDLEQWPP
jgi:nucleoside phosphorylase